MMRRLIVVLILIAPMVASGAEGGGLPFHFSPDLTNKASLQRGARDFMNYCSGCHTMKYMRYSQLAEDLGIPEDVVKQNLMMTEGRIQDQITGTMPEEKAAGWFGTAPPDMTLMGRQHSADWIYSFLLSFYVDQSRHTGMNNLVVKNVAMPWVLWPLQGYQTLKGVDDDGQPNFELAQEGQQSPEEFKQTVGDIVNFLMYVSEPMQLYRKSLGIKVIVFLLIFTILAYLLKREYWKDIH